MGSTYAEQVEAGAELLDRTTPGWFRRITLEQLDLSSSCQCVCAQLARRSRSPEVIQDMKAGNGGYFSYMKWLRGKRGRWLDPREYGFLGSTTASYRGLDQEWARVIRERLEAES